MFGLTIMRKLFSISLLLILTLHIGPASVSAQQNSNTGPLRIALLPILDALPYYVAEARDYFKEYGVDVKVVPVASGLARDQLMQSGEIDGMLNEMITTANFNRDRVQVQTVITARKAYPRFPLFRVLSSPAVTTTLPAGLDGVAVGISRNTVIEYVTDRLLAAAGLDPKKISKKSVPSIPERYQLLLQGQLEAATLPDPLAKSALAAGAQTVTDDSAHPQYSVSVLSFKVDTLRQKRAAVRAFLKGWDRAAADINQDPESHRALLLQKIRVPKNVQATHKIPPFPRREVPNVNQWDDAMRWMVDKGLLQKALPYEGSVTSVFLP